MIFDDFRKSINSILYERVTSPFWGAFASSWIFWNWQLIYITLIVSEEKLPMNKLEYLKANYPVDIINLLLFPLGISVLVLLIVPFVANGAYWLSLKFKKWKIDKKREINKTTLLSFKESTEIREEILLQEEKFHKLNLEKDQRILDLNEQINKLQGLLDENRNSNNLKDQTIDSLNDRVFKEIKNRNNYRDVFEGDWAFVTNKNKKCKFQVFNNDEVEIEDQSYNIKTIYRYNKMSFEILLIPRNFRSNDDYKIRFLIIKRSENMDDFEGFEWIISRRGEEFSAENNNILIERI